MAVSQDVIKNFFKTLWALKAAKEIGGKPEKVPGADLSVFDSFMKQKEVSATDAQAQMLNDMLYQFYSGPTSAEVSEFAGDMGWRNAETLVTRMTETELRKVADVIQRGLERGDHPWKIADRLDSVKGLDSIRARQLEKFEDYLMKKGLPKEEFLRQVDKYREKLLNDRKRTIAHTEARYATEEANYEIAKRQKKKYHAWISSGDGKVSDQCQDDEAAGWIPIGQEFPSGKLKPPGHPNCRCVATYRTNPPDQYIRNRAKKRAEKTKAAKDAIKNNPQMAPAIRQAAKAAGEDTKALADFAKQPQPGTPPIPKEAVKYANWEPDWYDPHEHVSDRYDYSKPQPGQIKITPDYLDERRKMTKEFGAIHDYTGVEYRDTNEYLNGRFSKQRQGWFPESFDGAKERVLLMDKGLLDIEPHPGKSFRGVGFPNEGELSNFLKKNNIEKGNAVGFREYLSTSYNERKAQSFAASGKHQCMFIIDGKSGRNIQGISRHYSEREVLFPRDRTFNVDRIEEKKSFFTGEKQKLIYLTEV